MAPLPRRRQAPRRTLVIGEALVDVVVAPDGSRTEHVGGSPLNVSVGLARLGHPVTLAAHIGRDERGADIGARLSEAGVLLVPGSDSAEDTSVATATLDEHGVADYGFDITWRVPALPDRSDHVHTGSIGALLRPGGVDVLAAMDGARARATTSYDPNIRPALLGERAEVMTEVERRIAVSDVVKASEEDIAWLLGHEPDEDELEEELARWLDLGPGLVVATLGAKGALALHSSGRRVRMPAPSVEVVDTVGAGDAAMAGLLSALLDEGLLGGAPGVRKRLRGASREAIEKAVRRAVTAGAATVTRAGAQLPTRDELRGRRAG